MNVRTFRAVVIFDCATYSYFDLAVINYKQKFSIRNRTLTHFLHFKFIVVKCTFRYTLDQTTIRVLPARTILTPLMIAAAG